MSQTTPGTPPSDGEKDESLLDKVKDIAGDIKDKGEELVDKVKDKLDGDKGDEPKPDAKH